MHTAYKFRHYPTKSQRTMMEWLDFVSLDLQSNPSILRKECLGERASICSKYGIHSPILNWKVENRELGDVFSQGFSKRSGTIRSCLKAFFFSELSLERTLAIPAFAVKDGTIPSTPLQRRSPHPLGGEEPRNNTSPRIALNSIG